MERVTDIPSEPDLSRPNAARMYDYYLGGATNLAVDREAAEYMLSVVPSTRTWARANRSFLTRAVRCLCEQGIDQFLDLGSGIPAVGNVHEQARRVNPHVRVAYVDFEDVAVTHARMLLHGDELTTVTQADIRYPERVLSSEGVRGLLDFDRPVGILAVAILHFVPDSDHPVEIMARYRDECVAGSYLVVGHMSPTGVSDSQLSQGHSVYNTTTTPVIARGRNEIARLLPGYTVVEPGVVLLDDWRPDVPLPPEQAMQGNGYAVVGVLEAK